MSNKVHIGSEIKLSLTVGAIGSLRLSDLTYDIYAYNGPNTIKGYQIPEEDIIVPDSDAYDYITIRLNTEDVGVGLLHIKFIAQIPDSDFEDGYRKEVCKINTGITILH